MRLWFKPQAVYLSRGNRHRLADARSMHVDLRELGPEALARKALGVELAAPEREPGGGEGETPRECDCWLCQRRRGCFVVTESDAPMPDGWCEVQRDDCPDHESVYRFDSDNEAAAWVSRSPRAVSVETGETAALVTAEDGSAVVSESWCPGHRVRLIVPILDATDRGLIDSAEEVDG